MDALLRTNGQSGCKPVKIKGQPSTSWFESMEPTIRLIGWAKRQARSERKAQRSNGGPTSRIWGNQKVGLGGYGSSDDCYSLSDDSGDEFEGVVRVAVAKGELKEELMRKDPKVSPIQLCTLCALLVTDPVPVPNVGGGRVLRGRTC